jgi:hypothetical protein
MRSSRRGRFERGSPVAFRPNGLWGQSRGSVLTHTEFPVDISLPASVLPAVIDLQARQARQLRRACLASGVHGSGPRGAPSWFV